MNEPVTPTSPNHAEVARSCCAPQVEREAVAAGAGCC